METRGQVKSTTACLLLVCATTLVLATRQPKTWPTRVLPGMPGFPSEAEFEELTASVNGTAVEREDAEFENATLMYNRRVTQTPYIVYLVESVEDVQKIVKFVAQHNLALSVRSSGHSFIGRSTWEGSVVISLARMKGQTFRLNSTRSEAGEVTVQSGNSWIEVYKGVDEQVTRDDQGNLQRRVVVGGSAHTVAIGGYTLGGGHSPVSRRLGLAVDNLLEATIVLADGRKAVVNAEGTTLSELGGQSSTFSDDTSLFWALKGGGGCTWGVVVDFTFSLHFAPERFRNVAVSWALNWMGIDIGTETLKYVLRQLSHLSRDWGGYVIVSGAVLGSSGSTGSLTLFLNHWGSNDSLSNSEVDGILNHNVHQHQYSKEDKIYDTFLQYEVTAVDPASSYSYIYDNFIHNDTINSEDDLNRLVSFLMALKSAPSFSSLYTCTGTLIGGRMNEVASGVTPISPKFRSGLLAMSCALSWWEIGVREDFYINNAMTQRNQLAGLGDGVYFNEAAEDLSDWKTQFWGTNASTYQRLLDAKNRWDPHHLFWCHNCVGSDLPDLPSTPVPSFSSASPTSVVTPPPTDGMSYLSHSVWGFALSAAVAWGLVRGV